MEDTIVLYPSPGMGHVIAMVELGKLILHRHGPQFAITVLLTTGFADYPSITSYISSISRSHPSISFCRFPLVSVDPANPPRSGAAVAFEFIRKNSANVLQSLRDISAVSTVRALIIDFFCTSALPVAKDLNIPTYYFYASGASSLAAFLYFPGLFERSTKSFKDQIGVILEFPGLPPLKATQMPEPTLDRDDPAYGEMCYFCDHMTKVDGILVNTFEALEPKAVELIASGACVPDAPTPPVYCIGPLIADESSRAGDSTVGGQQDCLSWLEKQPRKSVVFLCFGSRGTLSAAQIKEVAVGLEKSGHRFLWVVKNPSGNGDMDLEALMPEGFLERTKERGMVVRSWAPQVAVLRKEAVGGFVTHCGWNSVLEAVAAGVALVAWPLYAEQHMNRNFLVQHMEMAIGVEQRDGDGFVSGDEVERAVRELMESERGRELREKSWAMREEAAEALGDFGSSTTALAKSAQKWSGAASHEA
ncbi:UDP-glycosyltransferase 88F3-like isoform X2 [Rhodamnia argentea]|uniref:UDP-glycosyltransferase 88F3-like isoform X2 n=1 Tax=Rhodamnia argentea TaxID=178133 RepID=A0A8B8NUY5_9MYRT|nr:UDP-glycosyltransferase 88F3-like isoform X2 [Rhodamnia argentea]